MSKIPRKLYERNCYRFTWFCLNWTFWLNHLKQICMSIVLACNNFHTVDGNANWWDSLGEQLRNTYQTFEMHIFFDTTTLFLGIHLLLDSEQIYSPSVLDLHPRVFSAAFVPEREHLKCPSANNYVNYHDCHYRTCHKGHFTFVYYYCLSFYEERTLVPSSKVSFHMR